MVALLFERLRPGRWLLGALLVLRAGLSYGQAGPPAFVRHFGPKKA